MYSRIWLLQALHHKTNKNYRKSFARAQELEAEVRAPIEKLLSKVDAACMTHRWTPWPQKLLRWVTSRLKQSRGREKPSCNQCVGGVHTPRGLPPSVTHSLTLSLPHIFTPSPSHLQVATAVRGEVWDPWQCPQSGASASGSPLRCLHIILSTHYEYCSGAEHACYSSSLPTLHISSACV